jgi:hypothetical protein
MYIGTIAYQKILEGSDFFELILYYLKMG